MFSRVLIGFLTGLACGACVGAAGFAASAALFGRGIGFLGPSPLMAAIVGAVSLGISGAVVGAVVGGINPGKARGLWAGGAAGLLMAALWVWRGEHNYSYAGGYFDRQLFLGDVLDCATWVFGLAFVAFVVSAVTHKLSASRR